MKNGVISDEILRRIERDLDLEALRPLIRGEMRIVGVVRRRWDLHPAGQGDRNPRDVGLVLGLAVQR